MNNKEKRLSSSALKSTAVDKLWALKPKESPRGLIWLHFALLLLFALTLFGCTNQIKHPTVSIGNSTFSVELAVTPSQREIGLMNRDSLEINSGMLFIFEEEHPRAFWMKNTKIPLDIIFIDNDKKIISIWDSAQPCTTDPCPIYPSKNAIRYVLEINGAEAEKRGIKEGDKIRINLSSS